MDALLQSIQSDARIIGDLLVAAPDAQVVHCPGWSVADLVAHHGEVHRWSRGIVLNGAPGHEDFPAPEDIAARATWYAEGAAALVEALEATDPERECWTFGRPPAQAWFWTRRQALEAAIHRWDAENAAGPATGFSSEIATAGLTEVAEDLFPRQVALERTPALSASLTLVATDLGRTWTIGPDGEPAGELTASGAALFLLLWRRIDLGDEAITYSGSAEFARELEAAHFAP
jgi:uncharacterized protein (TIGR03083 family)